MNKEHIKRIRSFRSTQNKLKKENRVQECFHNNENCSGKIIKAHSIQNNKILKKISDDGEVLMFNPSLTKELDFSAKLERKGRKIASTFTGFCGYHDRKIFSPIENFDYEVGNKEQNFLFAYRALAKEYNSKKTAGNIYRGDLNTYGCTDLLDFWKVYLYGQEDIEEKLEKYKERANGWLDDEKFENITTLTLTFEKEYYLAVSGMAYIEYDLNGSLINNLEDMKTSLAPIFITVFPQNGKTYILLSYFTRNKRYNKLMKQLVESSVEEKRIVLSNIILFYFENVTFSPLKWEELDEKTQYKIEDTFLKTSFTVKMPDLREKIVNLFI